MTTHAIQIHQTGGPETLEYAEIDTPTPAPNEALITQTAIGLNFIDVYFRTGLYPCPTPFTPGMEGVGVITELGPETENKQEARSASDRDNRQEARSVSDRDNKQEASRGETLYGKDKQTPYGKFKIGDRVGYASTPLGAYATHRTMPTNRLIKIPNAISDETAAAALVKGMTAEYLLHRTYKVQPGQTILFHAAAGGVGLIACQWAKALGATVIGTVGSEEKAALAKANGCDHVIQYNKEDIATRVHEITNGKGVPVVYDSVGQATFECSLNCLQTRGTMVSFGNASGPVPPFAPSLLTAKGSLHFTRPSMNDYTADDQEYQDSANRLFQAIENGHITVPIHQRYKLENAAQAHKDLEARKTTGSSIFTC